jgi:fucose permease
MISAASLVSLIYLPSIPIVEFPIVAIVGIGFGPIFPNMIAAGAERFPSRVASMTSIVAGGAALGGVALPWMMGVMLVASGRNSSIEVALAATLAMVAVLAALDLGAAKSHD